MILTQKETMLLQEMKSQEQLCIEKYSRASSQSNCPQLKQIFTQLGQQEQQHLNTINQMTSGTVPATGNSQQQGQQQQQQQQTPKVGGGSSISAQQKQQDAYLCQDMLATEKYVSSVYDTCVFEFKDVGMRNALNHIQKEEQEHGKKIYDYMSQNGMYN